MAVAETHPSVEQLTAFTLGTLDEETQAPIEAHVTTCPSCQERAAETPGDSLVELLRRVHARTSRRADTFVEAAAQMQTPVPLLAVALTDAFLSAVSPSAPAESNCPEVADALLPELTHHERYRVVRLLGVGGMGTVYEAEHRVMERPVALKVIKRAYTASAAALERFRREVRAAARLSHPNIVTTYDAEDAGETHFLVMEYVEGIDLGRLVQERGPLPVDRACDYIRQAALGLLHAFEQGMVHRDLKPHNLMLTPDGRVKILDFGLARFASESADAAGLTSTGIVLGTVDYIAPEQADNAHQADIRSDIYSLGCSLYHLLAAQPPFPTGTPLQKVMAHLEKKPQPLTEFRDDLPEGLMPVLERMMAKNPQHRYQTPAEVAFALEPFTRATAVARAPKPRPRARTTDPSRTVVLARTPVGERRRPRLATTTAILAFFVAGLLGMGVYRIATDKGELVIETDNDDVEVVVSKGGKVVKIIDTKSGNHVTLNSGEYELALKDGGGLKISPGKITLKRGKTELATITREPKLPASKYLLLPLDKVATAVSTKSLFSGGAHERLIFPKWGKQEVFGIPFDVIDPKGDSVENAIVLYGPGHKMPTPTAVRLKCGSPAKAIHLLSGVAGSGYPVNNKLTVCLIVRLHYRDGTTEDHELINGVHFCDIGADENKRYHDVPRSRLAIRLLEPVANSPTQIRYLAVEPKNPLKVIEEIEFIKPMKEDATLPVIMAVTLERRGPSAEKSAEKVGEARTFLGHTRDALCVAYSRDGQYAVSGGDHNIIRVWEVATGKQIHTFASPIRAGLLGRHFA